MSIENDESLDEERLNYLGDIGNFLLTKPDGGNYRLTIIKNKAKAVFTGETLRQVLDSAAKVEFGGV